MSHAAESFLREVAPAEAPRAPAGVPTAHPIAMPELTAPRVDGVEHARPGQTLLLPPSAALDNLPRALLHVKVALTVSVGSVEITLGELLEAKQQQVIRLDRTIDQPVDVLLDGRVVARGTLVAVDDQFGVRITELPLASEGPLHPRGE